MDISVRSIGGKYNEIRISYANATIDTGLLDHTESVNIARELLLAAEQIFWNIGLKHLSDMCGGVCESANETNANVTSAEVE